ncbi:MFS transporter [Gulosibacter molinativorax]|uniref:MFS transporter n=1 Tax=Gulosibacter molinativorax TaxID=256821 RepID=A0ABT7C625_9MICO|nr:MFS transporter [Gulosibacter molinativorax]MDJ1370629.1 MFS transporter [Gulosibacter molinativorax]QUY61957.1 Shikimate transporter [Gulosibacter molinativorax]
MSAQLQVEDVRATTERASTETKRDRRRAFLASYLGTVVEYYDFILYGAAAGLVFPYLFFADLDPVIGTVLSYTILLSGYIARPIGGLVCGHLGDKFGRKNILVVTMFVMGAASVLMGLLPTYAMIGAAAPVVLTLLRIIQGLAVGGEWAGATLMAAEHAGEKNRGFGAAITLSGSPTGSLLSTIVFALVSGLPEDAFMSWGWRLPFILSAALVIIGIYLRSRVSESPEFEAARAFGRVHSGVPLMRILRRYSGTSVLLILSGLAPLFLNGVMVVFMVPYLVGQGYFSQQTALLLLSVSTFLQIFTTLGFGALSDKLGRSRAMMLGALAYVVLAFPAFMLLSSGSVPVTILGFILANGVLQAALLSPLGAFLADHFATEDRYTGMSLTFQISSILGAGVAPLLATWLVGLDNGWGIYNVAAYVVVLAVVSLGAVLLLRLTGKKRAVQEVTR